AANAIQYIISPKTVPQRAKRLTSGSRTNRTGFHSILPAINIPQVMATSPITIKPVGFIRKDKAAEDAPTTAQAFDVVLTLRVVDAIAIPAIPAKKLSSKPQNPIAGRVSFAWN